MKNIIKIIFCAAAASIVTVTTIFSCFAAEPLTDFKNVTKVEIQEKDDKYVILGKMESEGTLVKLFELNKTTEEDAATMYVNAKIGLNVRNIPTTEKEPIAAIAYGTEVKRIGIRLENETENYWELIEFNGEYAFIWSEYLTNEKPIIETSQAASADYEPDSSSSEEYYASSETSTTSDPALTYFDYCDLTAYEWTGNPCANGNYPTAGYTVACNTLPMGTQIYIEGYGYYVVEDRGGMPGNGIDIYMGDPDTCINFGRQYANVYIVN